MALAAALGVSPVTLLQPAGIPGDEIVTVCDTDFKAAVLWEWLIAEWPFPGLRLMEFFSKALPPWKLVDVERRIAERHGAESIDEIAQRLSVSEDMRP